MNTEESPPEEVHASKARVSMIVEAFSLTPEQKLAAIRAQKPVPGAAPQRVVVELILSGRINDAIASLREMERVKPGEYRTAANLGTALELQGNLEEALVWINEGIRRNPDSHQGTEWLHAKILEAKIALKKDPKWLDQHPVVELVSDKLLQPSKERLEQDSKLADAIGYQLKERMVFVKPKDPTVANLLFSLSKIEAANHTDKSALAFYKLAKIYGLP